jgi:hypothetical protein
MVSLPSKELSVVWASAQIMAQRHVNPVMSKRLGHELCGVMVIVRWLESSCRWRQRSVRCMRQIEHLCKCAAIAVDIQVLGNVREDQVVSCSASFHGEHVLLFARQHGHRSRFAPLAIHHKDRWATGDQVVINDVAHPYHFQLITSESRCPEEVDEGLPVGWLEVAIVLFLPS